MRNRFLGCATGALLLALPATGAAQDSMSGEQRWQQVVACAAEADPAQRHACMDGVVRAAGVLDPVAEAAHQRENYGRSEVAVAPVAPPAPARPVAEAQPVAAPAPIEGIVTTVAAARLGADRRLLVATPEGAVWRQVDDEQIRLAPTAGTPFAVQDGALGSFRCTVGRSTHYRCERAD